MRQAAQREAHSALQAERLVYLALPAADLVRRVAQREARSALQAE